MKENLIIIDLMEKENFKTRKEFIEETFNQDKWKEKDTIFQK